MGKKAILNTADRLISSSTVNIFGEKPGLSTFLFHGIYKNQNEIDSNSIFPQENLTLQLFREFLDYFLFKGYQFIGPDDMQSSKLQSDINYGLITLDDGYFNNTLLLDTLSEYKVPAVFFVPTAFITEGEKLWSDVIFSERRKMGIDYNTIFNEIMSLKPLRVAKIKDYITKEFGKDKFKPKNDIDRPMTEAEFRSFAKHPLVHIGNHTHRHEVLGLLSEQEILEELTVSQKILTELTGTTPDFISYPYGSYSDSVLDISKKLKFKSGITTIQKKNIIPIQESQNLLLNRFNPVVENGVIHYKKLRSSFQFKTLMKKWLQ